MAHERWDHAVYRATPAPATTVTHDVGLLVLRLFLGLTMAAHGTQKLFGWFHGPGLAATGKGFSMSGYPAGDAMAVIAGLAETLGGLGLALGLLTPLAGAALIGTFINILDVRGLSPFSAPKGVELELALLAGIVALTLTGPGRFSVDHFLPVLRESRPRYSVLGLLLGVVAGVVVLLIRD
ncbi:Putative oxidoreductase MhqP (plasmid) [Streptomyces sp. ADI95-16]|uniref:DoxX family protein n=1 Tax=Streptomyces sp. ADI95-16 TaxID=1522758 RepID=UPI000F3A9FEC|nr:DoxX family protein [Streptomyces sp. ADI95-16]AYV32614.1 Putative oxidoreductase MhqP [Streptomyces sp. ADI95-16]